MSPRTKQFLASPLLLAFVACGAAPLPEPLTQANLTSASQGAQEAKEEAPQAYAKAEQLRAEATALHDEGRSAEAAVVSEESLAAFEEAFALVRALRAESRVEYAKAQLAEVRETLARINAEQERTAKDADAYEMRARVALDREEVTDISHLTKERALARRQAAIQLTAEARLLCISAKLIGAVDAKFTAAVNDVESLEKDLSVGSINDDLYPRAAQARTTCLSQLSLARRGEARQHPEAPGSDRLLKELSETGQVFAFRDDRGVVVNILSALGPDQTLTEPARTLIKLLGQTSKEHPEFPILVVSHSAKRAGDDAAEKAARAVAEALSQAGAAQPTIHLAGNRQPVVHSSIRGADERNSRVEVVFVTRAR